MDDLSVLSLELLKCVPKLDAWNLLLWLMIQDVLRSGY